MTARSALTVVGQVVGAYFGPVGSAIGGFIGGAIGGAIDGPVRNSQALIDDLNAIKFDYGSSWPRIYGRYRFKVSPMWTSTKRPVAHETEVDSKGGPSAVNKSWTYSQDWLCWAPLNAKGWARIWINGEIKATRLIDSDASSLAASVATTSWGSVTFFDGNAAQMPWPVYEAIVGTENAVAFRDRPTLAFESLDLGPSGQPPLVEVEYYTDGTESSVPAKTILQSYFDLDNSTDISAYENGAGTFSMSGATVSDGVFVVNRDNTLFPSTPSTLTYNLPLPSGLSGTPLTIELYATWGETPNIAYTRLFEYIDSASERRFGYYGNAGRVVYDDTGFGEEYVSADPVPGRVHFAMVFTDTAFRVYINGQNVYETAGDARTNLSATVILGDRFGYSSGFTMFTIDEFAVRREELYTTDFSPPEHIKAPDASYAVVDLLPVDLSDIVRSEETLSWSAEAGALGDEDIDVSELVGIDVTGYGTSGSPRESVQQLMDVFYFGARCSDKLYHPLRGAASIGSVPFADTGVGVGQSVDPFTGLERGNDLEVAVQIAVTGPNLLTDYEPGTESSDRLIGESVQLRQYTTPVVFLPTERKGRADTMVLDGRVGSHVAQVSLDDRHVEKECFDVWTQFDDEGNSYRVRADAETYADGARTFSVALDDATILASVGITTEVDERAITVLPPAETQLVMIDGPIFRDADNDAGNYAAANGTADNWGGAKVFKSSDDISFTPVATILENAVIGTTSGGPLGDWAGGDQFDETNMVTINVGRGTLTSSTRAAMLLDDSANAAVIGADDRWEAIRFRTATLLADGVYILTGLLRGQRGTEWAMGSHAGGDTFVLIRTAGIRRVPLSNSEIGMLRYYRGVSIGTDGDAVTSQTLTGEAVGLKPFSPVDLRIERQVSSGDNVITWRRRTRLATRFGGPMGDSVPLGEDIEAYRVELYTDGTFTTLLRSLGIVTSATATYVAADQSTDGVSQSAPMYVRVYQISAVVGNGYALEEAA